MRSAGWPTTFGRRPSATRSPTSINRNINFTNVCYVGCRFCAFAQREVDAESYTLTLDQVADRAEEAWTAGATEVCMQGGIHPDLPGSFYFDLLDAIRARTPGMHIHAFSPMEILNGATKLDISFREFLQECRAHGLGTIPGTAAEILDDDVRWLLTKGKLPADTWEEIVRTAHDLGIRSSSTIMFGHVDAPPHWVAHIRRLGRIQQDTGGFTEFVPLPFVHQNAPIYLAGKARPGATFEENLRMHAVARILLDGLIPNIQVSWVKLGIEACQAILQAGANDFGGTLMEETISRMAGAEWGIRMTPDRIRRRDPRDRSRSRGAHDDVRPGRQHPEQSICLTVTVKLLDRHFSSLGHLHTAYRPDTMVVTRDEEGREAGNFLGFPLVTEDVLPSESHGCDFGGRRGVHHYIPWQERARCRDYDPEVFFPEKGGSSREAKRICSECPVRIECLNYALRRDERYGVWGGMSERERRRLKRMAS